jgi:hypothetical protein
MATIIKVVVAIEVAEVETSKTSTAEVTIRVAVTVIIKVTLSAKMVLKAVTSSSTMEIIGVVTVATISSKPSEQRSASITIRYLQLLISTSKDTRGRSLSSQ